VADALRQVGFQSVELAMDLDRDAMAKALHAFRDQADKADWALVCFAGHGIEINRGNYLIPVDVASRGSSDRGLVPPPEEEAGTLIVYSAKDGQPSKHRPMLELTRRCPSQEGGALFSWVEACVVAGEFVVADAGVHYLSRSELARSLPKSAAEPRHHPTTANVTNAAQL